MLIFKIPKFFKMENPTEILKKDLTNTRESTIIITIKC